MCSLFIWKIDKDFLSVSPNAIISCISYETVKCKFSEAKVSKNFKNPFDF